MADQLLHEIKEMIAQRRETKHWDYKEYHHENQADLLHDIICMANNTDLFKPSYIIFGVNDQGDVKGIDQSDPNRKKQHDIVTFLKDKNFAEGRRPDVHMKSDIGCSGKLLDVLIIENDSNTPYYLTREFKAQPRDNDGNPTGKPRKVMPFHIYTRINDTNVDIDRNADPHIVERLWKKRFGLLLPPELMFKNLLLSEQDWVSVDNAYYNTYHPEYTIDIEYKQRVSRKTSSELAAKFPPLPPSGVVRAKYYGTTLYSRDCIGAKNDGVIILLDIGHLHFDEGKDIIYKYFMKDSILSYLYNFFNIKSQHSYGFLGMRGAPIQSPFLIFESEHEQISFTIYAEKQFSKFVKYGGGHSAATNAEAVNRLFEEYQQ